ncbi:MAG: hypothetical protein WDO68_24305 [Gammaproteobacteria bacterium]
MSAPRRDYLVFFRSGPNSLHPRLLAEDPHRNWDCAVSYWASAQPPDDLAEMYSTGGGNKFDGFVEFWRTDLRSRGYRYYLLLDDDVYFEPGDISRLLTLCDRHHIELAQPALKWSTFFNHNVTVENRVCELRRVSFVEVMAACFSAPTLERLLPTFSGSRSTWGIDWAWACLMRDKGSLHVVDAVAIDHTKVVDVKSGALYRRLRAEGVDFRDELNQARTQYGEFGRRRTRSGPHVYRKGIPPVLGFLLVHVFESLKVFARQQKKLKRYWHKRAAAAR